MTSKENARMRRDVCVKQNHNRCMTVLCLLISVLVMSSSCGKKQGAVNGGHAASTTTGVNDILQSGLDAKSSGMDSSYPDDVVVDFTSLAAYTSQAPLPSDDVVIPEFTANEEGVEVDLTVLSSAAVYSVVYDMMTQPENYVGKVVKMQGMFDTFYDEATGIRYYACVIQDATQCCAQGIEFQPEEQGAFPDDYPEVGGECTVVGVFDTYTEGQYLYATLRKAKMTFQRE